MATTTNYAWETPDDTDLVKDGAAAIRTLGSSIDTTTKALNPSTTLGDIEYRSATANTNTRLGIGTTGQVLSVSGGVPAWTSPSSGAMTLIQTSTFSGVADTGTTFDNVFSSTYKNYKVFLNVTNSTGAGLLYRYRVAGADNTTSNYAYQRLILSNSSFNNVRETAQTNGALGDTTTTNCNWELTFFNPFETKLSYAYSNTAISASSPEIHLWNNGFNATTSFTGFTLYPSSGTITGEILVYGMKVA